MGMLDSQLSVKILVIQLILTDLILSYQLKFWPILSYQLNLIRTLFKRP